MLSSTTPTARTRRPTVGDYVHINAPGEKHHGMVGKIVEDDFTHLPYLVHFGHDGAEWYFTYQVGPVPDSDKLTSEADTTTARVSIGHSTTVTLQRPATADQISRALTLIPLGWSTTTHTYPDRIEIIATHEETSG